MELRRLEQLSFSPILTNLSECYNGLHIFRSLDKIDFMNDIYDKNVHKLNSVLYHDRLC